MRYKVNGNRILIKPAVNEGKTEAGLFIPETAQGGGLKWGVVAAETKSYFIAGGWVTPLAKEGDRVLYDELGSTKVRLDGEDYVTVRNEDVVVIDPA